MKKIANALNSDKALAYNLPSIQPPSVNQTIIINNPNFNINYIESPNFTIQARLTHRDNWNLNTNLREFSETRQLGFFNAARQTKLTSNNQTNSPYLLQKNKTQDVKNINKIKRNQTIDPYYHNKTKPILQKNNKSIPSIIKQSNITNNHTINQQLHLQHDKSKDTINNIAHGFRKRKYPYIQKAPNALSERKFQGVSPQFINAQRQKMLNSRLIEENIQTKQAKLDQNKQKSNIRKNKFELNLQPQKKNEINPEIKKQQLQNHKIIQDDQRDEDCSPSIKQNIGKNAYQLYNKTIKLIDTSLLSNVNNYLDGTQFKQQLAPTTIQLYISSLKQPGISQNKIEYKSSPIDLGEQFDFKFQDQKVKKRPKTPNKRKKVYQD